MADKSFGVKELNLLNASGTPTITSPNNLNLNANNVAISTNVTVGQNITISANAGIASLNVTGISTFTDIQVAEKIIHVGDTDTEISFGTDSINLKAGGNTKLGASSAGILIHDSILRPNTDDQVYLGTGSGPQARWKEVHAVTFHGDGSNLTGISAGISTSAWTVGHNGASNYVISGPGGLSSANNPDLYIIRGQTYQFIMNASGHGFGIQTVSGTWTGSNAYTTGITNAGAATGTITFQVPYSAPDRLYYACTSQHSGMVGNIYIQGGPSDIKMCDQWRRNAVLNTNNGENFITTDWERVDGSGQGTYTVNGGMSQSGGIFTFPRTGIYLVTWQAYAECTSTSRQNAVNIYITTNNSSYSNRASSVFSIGPDLGSYNYGAGHCSSLVDVTDTSQVKVKFRVYSSGNVAWDQSSAENRNVATFLRIGDT